MEHCCYMDGGSIINSYSGCVIEQPAILVSKEQDTLYGWGDLKNVEARFEKFSTAYASAGMNEDLADLMLIELSEYKIDREMACYVIRRAVEFTMTGFITNLCRELEHGSDPVAWLKAEMERIPIELDEKEWKRG